VTWRQADFARAELADRRRLRFPPAVRVATVTGTVDATARAIASLEVDPLDVLGPVDTGPGTVRTIVRFDYAQGAAVATGLRAQVISAATSRRRPLVAKGVRTPAPPPLRVRCDDVEPFLED
jgi:primosomal protein N' (replication factor Y)